MQSEGCVLSTVSSLLALMNGRAVNMRKWTADTTHRGQFDLLEIDSSTAQNEPCCSRGCHRFNQTVWSIVQLLSLWRTEGLAADPKVSYIWNSQTKLSQSFQPRNQSEASDLFFGKCKKKDERSDIHSSSFFPSIYCWPWTWLIFMHEGMRSLADSRETARCTALGSTLKCIFKRNLTFYITTQQLIWRRAIW